MKTVEFPIRSVSDLEKLSHAARWQHFEKLVAFIFEQNNYEVEQGVVVKAAGAKRQFDVIARNYGRIFAVECKKWRNRERISALRSAVRKHLERCDLYSIKENETVTPLIVTLLDDAVEDADGVAVVPVMKLNGFLNSL
jgi:hypothetical protein